MVKTTVKGSTCHHIEGMKVLIVEDNMINLSVLVKSLEKIGLDISMAPDGETALKLIPELKPDLVLLDIILPAISGFEVCKEMKANEVSKEIPIIFITGKTDEEDILTAFTLGGVDYITKPFNPKEALARVQTQLRLQMATKQLIEYAEKLEGRNKELDEFCAIASHDLKEPLRKITSFGERLDEECSSDFNKNGKAYLAKILDATSRMNQFINDLLEYSKISIETKQYRSVNLNTIVKEVSENLEALLEKTNGTINVDSLPTVKGIPLQFHQLFLNLISNALKFSKKDVAPIVNIQSLPAENGAVRIIIEDNGIGIESTSFKRIFNLFERLHGKSTYEGSGMGLAVCKKIVEFYKGTIQVESEPDKGTKFIIVLPQPKLDQ
jgi:two-component system sensor histidine kinase/response regulator